MNEETKKPTEPTVRGAGWCLALSAATTVAILLGWNALQDDNPWPGVYALGNPSIVEIHAVSLNAGSLAMKSGTGFVFRADGRLAILTNQHVVNAADNLLVRFYDKVETAGLVLDASSIHDLALVDVEGVRLERYGETPRGDSSKLRIGDPVMTIGHPVRESHHISVGFYTGRFTDDRGRTLLRISMAVDPGNSGGPLYNREGQAVGVISQKVEASSNIAFAIPIERIEELFAGAN